MSVADDLAEMFPDHRVLQIDGHDNAIVGIVSGPGKDPFLVYDVERILANLQRDGMSEDDALEWFNFNIESAFMGEGTPGFINLSPYYEP